MRLIDAAALCKEIKEISKGTGFYRAIYEGFENAVHRQPTIKAEPVRHGKWINAYDTHGGSYYKCSRCACYIEKIFFANDYEVNYCPNCGAKMDGDKNE